MTQASKDAKTPATPTTPHTWPGAFGLLRYTKPIMRVNLGTCVVLAVLMLVLSAGSNPDKDHINFPLLTLGTLVSTYISLLLYSTIFRSMKGEKVSLGQSLESSRLFLNYFLNSLLTSVLVFGAFLLFIIPGIFVLPRLILSSMFVIDKGMGPVEAIKASWAATEGHFGKIWGVIGAQIAFALLAITVIGIPFALYFLFMYMASLPVMYRFMTRS